MRRCSTLFVSGSPAVNSRDGIESKDSSREAGDDHWTVVTLTIVVSSERER